MKSRPWEPVPLNIRELYEDKYKIQLDEAAFCPGESKKDPWYFQVACKHGHVYAHSGKLLGFYCESANIRNRLHREHPEIEVTNWSDDGCAIFLFTPDQFDLIAEYAKPKRKRKLSKNDRKRLIETGQAYRFQRQKCGVELTKSIRESTISGQGVSEHGSGSETRSEKILVKRGTR